MKNIWVIRGASPALPTAMLGLQIRNSACGGCASVSDGPNRQDNGPILPRSREAGLCPGLLPPAPRGGRVFFLLTLRWSRVSLAQREASGAGVPEQAPASTRKAAALGLDP